MKKGDSALAKSVDSCQPALSWQETASAICVLQTGDSATI